MALMKEIKTFDRHAYKRDYQTDFPRFKNVNAITDHVDRYELSPCGGYLVEYSSAPALPNMHKHLFAGATGVSVAKRGSDDTCRGYSMLARDKLELREARIRIYTELFSITDVESVFGKIMV